MGASTTDREALAVFSAEPADRVCMGNPNLPVPITAAGETEIDLDMSFFGGDGVRRPDEVLLEEIEFENDEEVAFDAAAPLDLSGADGERDWGSSRARTCWCGSRLMEQAGEATVPLWGSTRGRDPNWSEYVSVRATHCFHLTLSTLQGYIPFLFVFGFHFLRLSSSIPLFCRRCDTGHASFLVEQISPYLAE